MANAEELKQMILSFRVSELHMLLGFAGRNKIGRKNELQSRALDLIQLNSQNINLKITNLFKSVQHQLQSVTALPAPAPVVEAQVNAIASAPVATDQTMQPQPNRGYSGYNSRPAGYPPGPYTTQYPQQGRITQQYPVHPDVRLKSLPFYELLGELLKPSTLVPTGSQRQQESTFVFHLSPQQANKIGMSRDSRPGKIEYGTQVQVRFCLHETTCEQEDSFPSGVMVKVNGKPCQLPNPIPTNKPNVEPKRPPRPVNITNLVKISPLVTNTIQVQWSTDYTRGYVISAYLVNKKTSEDLLNSLKAKGVRRADYTRAMIKDKLKEDADSEIATTSLRVSLVCPLGKMRMTTPCRSSTCGHFQCFDASLYLQMNEKKATWMCPVCDKPALYDKLVIDGYFQEVLVSPRLPDDGNEIHLNMDGSWTPLVVGKNKDQQSCVLEKTEPVKMEPKIEPVAAPPVAPCAKKEESADVSIVTLSDSDDEPLIPAKWQSPPQEGVTTTQNTLIKESSNSYLQPPQSPSIIILDGDSPPASPAASTPSASYNRGYSTAAPSAVDSQLSGFSRY